MVEISKYDWDESGWVDYESCRSGLRMGCSWLHFDFPVLDKKKIW